MKTVSPKSRNYNPGADNVQHLLAFAETMLLFLRGTEVDLRGVVMVPRRCRVLTPDRRGYTLGQRAYKL